MRRNTKQTTKWNKISKNITTTDVMEKTSSEIYTCVVSDLQFKLSNFQSNRSDFMKQHINNLPRMNK